MICSPRTSTSSAEIRTYGPGRAHLDHGTDDREAEVRRLVELGADPGAVGRGWQVLRDPAGLTFCVTDNSPSTQVPRDIG